MKKILIITAAFILSFGGNVNAQNSVQFNGEIVTIKQQRTAPDIHSNCTKSKFKTEDGQQLWFTKNGSYFVFAISKKGNEYRKYFAKEISEQLKAKENK